MAETVYTQLHTQNKIREAERKQQRELNKQIEEQERLKEEKEKAGFWEKLGVTIADVFTELGGGLLKLVEGVVDAGVSIAGGVGGLFGADTQWAEDIVKFDATQEWYYGAWEDDFTQHSYINDAPIVKDIVRGVGQQLPTIAAIALAPVTGGASLGALPYTIGATIASAGGSGVEEALNEDAEFGEAFAYGLLQSGVEGAVEYVTAGLGKGITSIGKSVTKGVGKTAAKSIGKVMLEEAASEAVEEGLSALINPLTKTTYQGAEALEAYKDMTFYLDAAQQTLVGGIVGGITASAGAIVNTKRAGGKVNYSIEQSAQEIIALDTKENNLWKNNKLDSKNIEKIDTQRQVELNNISNQLKSLDVETRKASIEKYGLSSMFNEDGSIINQTMQGMTQVVDGEQIVAEQQKTARKPLISDNIEAYSPSLRNVELIYAPTSNVLSETSTNAKKFITTLDSNARVVVSDSMPANVDAFYDTNERVFYLSNNATVETIAGHEFTHSLEGTAEYKSLADYILNNVEDLDAKIEQKKAQYAEVNKEVKQGENGEQVALYEAQTEIVAEEMGKFLSDPKAIERIVNQNKSAAHRIVQWIKDVIAKLTKRGNKGKYYNYIRTAEKLYANAVRNSIGGISLSDIAVFEELEKLAKSEAISYNEQNGDLRYSKKSSYSQYQTLAMTWANESGTKAGDLKVLYNPKTDAFNLLEADGNGEFTILKQNKNYEVVKNLYEELINEQGSNFEFNESIKEFEESVRRSDNLDLWGTENNETGDTISRQAESKSKNAGNGNTKTNTGNSRYALKDSSGNQLSKEQVEFFKDSKVRDDDGNLRVMYHGTGADFNVFDLTKSGASNANKSHIGFWFTPKLDVAEYFAGFNTNSYAGEKERVLAVYLNIKNPKVYDLNIDNTKTEVAKLNNEITELKSKVNGLSEDIGKVLNNMSQSDVDKFIKEFKQYGSMALSWFEPELSNNQIDAVYEIFRENEHSQKMIERKETRLSQMQDNDPYLQMSDDFDAYLRWPYQTDRNYERGFGREGFAAENFREAAELFRKDLIKQGYDGIILKNTRMDNSGDQVVAFSPEQIKNIDNKTPTTSEDIRYSLKDGEGDYNYSKGQIAKYVAEHSKLKAYSKTDAEQIINTIVSSQLGYGNKYGELSNKNKNQVINTLWHSLNTNNEGYRAKAVLDIADYIINNAVMEDMYGDVKNEAHLYTVSVLKDYLHKVDLTSIKGEIKNRYDNDNSPYLLWGKRANERGQSPDQIAMEIAERGISIEAVNDADIFFEMDRMYRDATKNLKKVAKEKLADIASKEDLAELKQKIAKELLISFDSSGHKTMFANTIEKYTSKISQLKQAVKDIKAFNKAKNNAISTIERLRDEFVKSKPAGWKVPQQVADFVKKISKVETWRNNISKTAREHLLELNNQIDLVMDETQQQIYPFRETLKELGSGKGELTTQELQTLDTVLRQFAWQLRNYNKVNFEEKTQDVETIATQGVYESKQAKSILRNGSNFLIKFKNKVYTNPFDRLAEIGLYRENSIAMRLYRDMLQGDRNRAKLLYDVNQSFNSFFDKNKGYLKELQKPITLGDITLTKRQALSLYCTSLREQGRSHLFNQGNNSGVVRILDNKYSTQGKTLEAFAKGKDVTITDETIAQIKKSLTDTDKAYLDVVDNFFNKISKEAKKTTDQKLYGITNIEDGYYFPIKVSNDKIYTEAGQNNVNINQYILDLGMNKSTKPHASNKIVIDGIDNIISNHLQSLSLYYGYAVPLTAYNRIMNKQVIESEGADSTSNMRGEIQKIDVEFESYMNKLWQDVQGIRRSDKGFVSSLLSKIRWAGANSALGANPKVLVTQTLSLAAGISEFNPKYVAKGMGHFFGEKQKLELAKYSSLMWERMEIGNSVDIADIRQIGKEIGAAGKITARATKFLNDFTTKPISWMDSNVIQSLWFAAQYEVADTKGKGYEFGTEANKVEAGKRLDEVVFRTQQTSDPLGRSEWMRSQNEIIKFARMFTGDSIQLTGRLIASVNKYNIAKKMIKSGDTALIEQGHKMLSSAKKGVAKASSAFILNQTMLLAMAMAFKWLKGKNDDEEWSDIAKNEAIANIMGLIPFGGDIYEKLLGYEPTNMAYTALSNTVEIGQDLYEGISTLISGNYQDSVKRNAAIRKTALSMSRLLGIPTQNLESYIKGVVGHVSPGTREEYEALFKTKSNTQYLKKIQQATEDGNEELADTIINIMFDSRTGKIKDDKVLAEKRALIELGYDVIPKSVGNSVTFDSVEYTLTSRQHTQFMKIYSQANDKVKTMVNTSSYQKLEDGAKAKAMNFIYNYYYNLAIEDLLGEDLETKTILFAEAIPIEQLAMAIAQAQLYTADTDKDGKSISGTKKAKIQSFIQSLKLTATQKYMVMGYLGYSNKYGEALVWAYINRLNLSKTQKQELLEMSGYAA